MGVLVTQVDCEELPEPVFAVEHCVHTREHGVAALVVRQRIERL